MSILLAFFCAISSNLDTFGVSIAYGIKKIRISTLAVILISIVTSLSTYVSMKLGYFITTLVGAKTIQALGAMVLIFIGLYFILTPIFKKSSLNMLEEPEKADKDKSGKIDVKESVLLSIALSANNVGVGVASSVAGISIFYTVIFTFILSIVTIFLGKILGKSYIANYFEKHVAFVSGLLIIFIGLGQLLEIY